MTTIYLIRHGAIAGNEEGALQACTGHIDLPLNQDGQQQAAALEMAMREVHLDAIYCSSLQRTAQTVAGVARSHHLKVLSDAAWDELKYGDWEGLTVAQIRAEWGNLWDEHQADPAQVRTPNGENYAEVWQRLEPAWQLLLEKHEGQSVAVCAHKGTIRLLLAMLLEMPMKYLKRIDYSNTGISRIYLQDAHAAPLIRYINNTSHLESQLA